MEENELIQMKEKLLKDKDQQLAKLKASLEKKDNMLKETERLRDKYTQMNNELSLTDKKIEKVKNNIDEILGGEDRIGEFSGLEEKCKEIISKLIPPNYHNKVIITRKENTNNNVEADIDGPHITFQMLKEKYHILFNLQVNDFFFADENGVIYLDSLSVEQKLFPIPEFRRKTPVKIYLVDSTSKELRFTGIMSSKREEIKKSEIEIVIEEKSKKMPDHWSKKLSVFIMFILFVILNVLWYFNTENFKNDNLVLEYRSVLGKKLERDFLYGGIFPVSIIFII